MEINPEIYEILKEFKINKDQGILALLGIYFNVDINTTCDPLTIRGLNLAKIVVKDYTKKPPIIWNVPLFKGQQTEWGWLEEWNAGFRRINPDRTASLAAVTTRMQDFFKKNPKWRQDDVIKATFMYLKSVKNPEYLKSSDKFIAEGQGAVKTSALLGWLEKLTRGGSDNNLKGRMMGG